MPRTAPREPARRTRASSKGGASPSRISRSSTRWRHRLRQRLLHSFTVTRMSQARRRSSRAGFALGSGRHGSTATLGPVIKPHRRLLVELQEHHLHHVLSIGYPSRLIERDAVHHVGVGIDDLSVLAVVHKGFLLVRKGKAPTPQPLACRPVTAFHKRPFTDNTLESGEMCDAWERFWDCENQPKTAAALPWSSARRRLPSGWMACSKS